MSSHLASFTAREIVLKQCEHFKSLESCPRVLEGKKVSSSPLCRVLRIFIILLNETRVLRCCSPSWKMLENVRSWSEKKFTGKKDSTDVVRICIRTIRKSNSEWKGEKKKKEPKERRFHFSHISTATHLTQHTPNEWETHKTKNLSTTFYFKIYFLPFFLVRVG